MKESHTLQITKLLEKLRGEKQTNIRDEELYALIHETQEELARCRHNLQFADSPALTDMYIYSIKAHEMRYAHLLRLARKADAV